MRLDEKRRVFGHRSYSSGEYVTDPLAVPVDATHIEVSLFRDQWPTLAGRAIVDVTTKWSIDGGQTWYRDGAGFSAEGGELEKEPDDPAHDTSLSQMLASMPDYGNPNRYCCVIIRPAVDLSTFGEVKFVTKPRPSGARSNSPSYDTSGENQGSGVLTLDVSLTISSAADRYAWIASASRYDVTSCEFPVGTTLPAGDHLVNGQHSLQNTMFFDVFQKVGGPSGAQTARFNYFASGNCAAGAQSVTNVNPITPHGGSASYTDGSSATPSLTGIPSAADELVLDSLMTRRGNANASPDTPQVESFNIGGGPSGTGGRTCAGSRKAGAAPNVSIGWSISNSDWALCAISLREAGAPPAGRIMSSMVGPGGLVAGGGIAGAGGGLAA